MDYKNMSYCSLLDLYNFLEQQRVQEQLGEYAEKQQEKINEELLKRRKSSKKTNKMLTFYSCFVTLSVFIAFFTSTRILIDYTSPNEIIERLMYATTFIFSAMAMLRAEKVKLLILKFCCIKLEHKTSMEFERLNPPFPW